MCVPALDLSDRDPQGIQVTSKLFEYDQNSLALNVFKMAHGCSDSDLGSSQELPERSLGPNPGSFQGPGLRSYIRAQTVARC